MCTHNLIILKKKKKKIYKPLLAVYCSCGAKIFGFDSTNVTINLYLMVLKIAI